MGHRQLILQANNQRLAGRHITDLSALTLASAPNFISTQLQEPNQLAGLTPWELDFRQMSKGSGQTDIAVRTGGFVSVLSIEMQCKVHQLGNSPNGLYTFGFAKPNGIRSWRGMDAPESAFIAFGSGNEFDGVSNEGFSATTVSIDRQKYYKLAEDFGLDDAEKPAPLGLLCMSESSRALGFFARKSLAFLDDGAHCARQEDEEEIGLGLLLATTGATRHHKVGPSRLRDRALKLALELIEESRDDPPTVRDLCVLSGASWPTLHRAFAERFGLGPKAYISNLRLSRIRADLLAAPSGAKVADIANRWGVWHMGQFARDYQKLFNRLPSKDLKK